MPPGYIRRITGGIATEPADGLFLSLQPNVVWRWAASRGLPTARSVDATVVSADISGFTRLAESLADAGPRRAAETLNATINQCFEPMIDEIVSRGGDVLKFGGDAVFAIFDGDDHQLQASAAAVRMQELLAATDVGLDPPLSMTVGIATGPTDLVLGGTKRCELVVHGSTVDTCLQLEADAEPGEVLVSEALASTLPDSWLERDDDVIVLTGPTSRDPAPPTVKSLDPLDTNSGEQDPSETGSAAGDRDLGEEPDHAAVLGPELVQAASAFAGAVGELRIVSVAFIDLPTADLEPQAVADTVDHVDQTCRRHGATMLSTDVNRGGIKFLLAAGAPVSGDADEDAMLGALVDIVHRADAPPMRAGVNRGLVYAGFLGSNRCRTLTVMGDPTNLAARLLGKAAPREIAVSAPVLDHARALFPTTELPPILVKGRLAPVTVHRLDGPARALRPSEHPAKLIGRDAEQAQLATALAEVRRGTGSVIQIVGEAGLGASRLVDAAMDSVQAGLLHFRLEGRLAQPRPYGAVQPMLTAIAGLDPTAPTAVEELTAWVERTDTDALRWLPIVAPMFGLDIPANASTEAVEPEFHQARAHQTIVELLAHALSVPTVFEVADAHRLDHASELLCGAIADRCGEQPWAMITSAQPEQGVFERHPVLRLEPLDKGDVETIVGEVADLPRERIAQIASQSGGNPGFAIELARADDLAGMTGAGSANAGGNDELIGGLSSIESLITARIDRLGHDARVLVRTAAVLGPRSALRHVDAVFGAADDASFERFQQVLGQVTRLVNVERDDLSGEEFCVFRSSIVHRVAYSGLSAQRRRALHEIAARVLSEAGAQPAALAWHYENAEEHQQCWAAHRAAAAEAQRLGLVGDVADHLERALAAADRADDSIDDVDIGRAMVELFDAAEATKRYAVAATVGRQALDRLDDSEKRSRLMVRLAFITAEIGGSYAEQTGWLRQEIDRRRNNPIDPRQDAIHMAWLLSALSSLHYRLDQDDMALEAADQTIAHAGIGGIEGPLPKALLVRQAVLADRTDDGRHAAGTELLETAERVGDTRMLIAGHNNIGLELQDEGHWDRAGEHYAQAMEIADQIGDGYRRMYSAINHATLLTDQGHWDAARPLLDELRRDAHYHRSGFHSAWAKRELARLEIHAGQPASGRIWLDEAAMWYRTHELDAQLYEIALLAIAADLASGNSAEVLSIAAITTTPASIAPRLLGRLDSLVGFAHLQRAQPDDALVAFGTALDAVADIEGFGRAQALAGRAVAETAVGRGRSARKTQAELNALLERLGVETLPLIPLPY